MSQLLLLTHIYNNMQPKQQLNLFFSCRMILSVNLAESGSADVYGCSCVASLCTLTPVTRRHMLLFVRQQKSWS